jgi:AbiV family abortive infection protein
MPTIDQLRTTEAACLRNAQQLAREADILFNGGFFARAFFLALTGIEELAKMVLTADARAGARSHQEWQKAFRRHEQKFALIAQIGSEHAYNPLERSLVEFYGSPIKPVRESCLYVDSDTNGDPTAPDQLFDREAAEKAIRGLANHTLGVKYALLLPEGPTSKVLNALAHP